MAVCIELYDDGYPSALEYARVNYFSGYHLEETTKFKKFTDSASHSQASHFLSKHHVIHRTIWVLQGDSGDPGKPPCSPTLTAALVQATTISHLNFCSAPSFAPTKLFSTVCSTLVSFL